VEVTTNKQKDVRTDNRNSLITKLDTMTPVEWLDVISNSLTHNFPSTTIHKLGQQYSRDFLRLLCHIHETLVKFYTSWKFKQQHKRKSSTKNSQNYTTISYFVMYWFVVYSFQLSCLVHINDEWISGVLSANRNLNKTLSYLRDSNKICCSAQYTAHKCMG